MIFDLELEKSFAEKSNSIAFEKIRKQILKEKKDRRTIPQQTVKLKLPHFKYAREKHQSMHKQRKTFVYIGTKRCNTLLQKVTKK